MMQDAERRQWEMQAANQPVFVIEDGAPALFDGRFSGGLMGSFADLLLFYGMERPFVVALSRFKESLVTQWLAGSDATPSFFDDFTANPSYDQICAGVAAFRASDCDSLISFGGGSAIDFAKGVRAYSFLEGDGVTQSFLGREISDSLVPHIAVPTTAGSGSESTHFAVMYVQGEKQSLADYSLMPTAAVLDPSLLSGLPLYQKKATLLDALCQAVESHWSVQSSEASRAYSAAAIPLIVEHAKHYLEGDADAAVQIAIAANKAGKAINLTTTTAPHAFSYKLTSLYGIPHGHAVALCMPDLWRLLIERCDGAFRERMMEVSMLMGGSDNPVDGPNLFDSLYATMALHFDPDVCEGDLDLLCRSVNQQRLSNFPIALSKKDISDVYRKVLHVPAGSRVDVPDGSIWV